MPYNEAVNQIEAHHEIDLKFIYYKTNLRNETGLADGESIFVVVTVSILISLGLYPFCTDVRFLADEPMAQIESFWFIKLF